MNAHIWLPKTLVTITIALWMVLAVAPAHAAKTVLVPFDSSKWGAARADGRGSVSGTKIRKVVLYEYSLGGNSMIPLRNSLTRLAERYGFMLERWTEQADVTPANLVGVDVSVFNQGAGDVLQPANSSYVNAMRNFVEVQGKGLLMVHEAASYIPCPTVGTENLEDANCRWLARVVVRQYLSHQVNDPTSMRIYADSVRIGELPPNATGAAAVPAAANHGRMNPETRMIFENLPRNGLTANPNQPYVWDGVRDEAFNWRGFPRLQGEQVLDGVVFGPVNVLLSLDETSYTASLKMGDHSFSWARKVGNGLTAYYNGGHSDVWSRARTGNALGATVVNDSFPEKYNWRLMKYLARDFAGCMAPSDRDYNPEASVLSLKPGDTCPCNTASNCSVTSVSPMASVSRSEVSLKAGVIRVRLSGTGKHRIRIVDVKGWTIFSAAVSGGGAPVVIQGLKRGVYFVWVMAPDGLKSTQRVNLF